MTPAEILAPICSTDTTRPNLTTPFGMDFKGKRWLAATDGHIAVALLGDAEMRAGAPDLAVILNGSLPPGFRANVAALRAWAGEPRSLPVDCDDCQGTGKVECIECNRDGAKCWECDGTGKVNAPPDCGAIFSGVLNRALLARVLATLPDDVTEVRIGQREPLDAYILRSKGWLAAIMPTTEKPAGLPKFTELEPVATVPA